MFSLVLNPRQLPIKSQVKDTSLYILAATVHEVEEFERVTKMSRSILSACARMRSREEQVVSTNTPQYATLRHNGDRAATEMDTTTAKHHTLRAPVVILSTI